MKPRPRVRVMYGPDDSRWYGVKPAHAHIVKQIPQADRYWNGNLRCWVTPNYVLATLPQWLDAAGYEVVVVDVSKPPAPRNWHAEYQRVIGHPCPHQNDKKAKVKKTKAGTGELEMAA